MPIPDPLYKLIKIPVLNMSKRENQLLEIILLTNLLKGLKEFFENTQKQEYWFIRDISKKEGNMFEDDFIVLVIKDILATGEYTLEGIAYYTNTHLDVIQELILKCSINPSLKFLRKLIELHRSVRTDLYEAIMKKFIQEGVDVIAK